MAPKLLVSRVEVDALKEPLKALRLPTAGLVCANEAETVAEVATRMSENNVGCTIVVKNGEVYNLPPKPLRRGWGWSREGA
jgi:CBS domain-containing protein